MNIMQGELQPAASLRRDQALAYIIEHIVRHGFSPTQDEIARALGGISTARVKELIVQLIKRGDIKRVPGSQRNLRVADDENSRRHVDEALRRLGWSVADPMEQLRTLPQEQLPVAPRLGQLPLYPGERPS